MTRLNTIQIYRSTGSTDPTDLSPGELCFVEYGGDDGSAAKLLIGTSGGDEAQIGGSGSRAAPAAAGTLTGATLSSTQTLSSLTTLGAQAETLDMGDNTISNVGDIDADSISIADAAVGLNIDFSGGNTAKSAITIADNLAEALVIQEGSNDYLQIVTTNSSEALKLGHGVSGTTITIGHGTSETTIGDNLTVSGNLTINGNNDYSDLAAGDLPNHSGGLITSGTVAAGRVATLNQNTTGTAVGLTGSGAISTGTTAVKQSAGTNNTTLATTSYVDDATDLAALGLTIHAAVACRTTANDNLSGELTTDGITTSTDRILVMDQSDATENGIYVTASGSWARAADMSESIEFPNGFVHVTGGTLYARTAWVCTNDTDMVMDTTDVAFAQFSAAGLNTAGDGLTLTGNDLDVDAAQTLITSVLNAGLTVGRDSTNVVDFATTDNVIIMKTDGSERLRADNAGVDITGALTVSGSYGLATGDIPNNAADTSGKATTSGTADLASTVTLVDSAEEAAVFYPVIVDGLSGAQALETESQLSFRPDTGILTATGFVGNITGDVTGTVATATVATTVTLTDESSDTTCFPVFAQTATGDIAMETGSNLTFNASSGSLVATVFTGPLTGNVTGDCSGTAGDATILETARTIGGTSFNGSANITVASATGGFAVGGGNLTIEDGDGVLVGGVAAQLINTGSASLAVTPELQVSGTSTSDSTIMAFCSSTTETDAGAPMLAFLKSGNATPGSKTIVSDDEVVGQITAFADDGVDYNAAVAGIQFVIDGTPGTGDTPGRIEFKTTADGGQTLTLAMTIDASQNVTFENAIDGGSF